MAPQPRTGLCAKCVAGTFQENSGSEACVACYAGSYCRVGAAAALPCVAGTFSSATGLAAPEECSACPLGAACSTGATAPGALAQSKASGWGWGSGSGYGHGSGLGSGEPLSRIRVSSACAATHRTGGPLSC
jgi:hypothetical protein